MSIASLAYPGVAKPGTFAAYQVNAAASLAEASTYKFDIPGLAEGGWVNLDALDEDQVRLVVNLPRADGMTYYDPQTIIVFRIPGSTYSMNTGTANWSTVHAYAVWQPDNQTLPFYILHVNGLRELGTYPDAPRFSRNVPLQMVNGGDMYRLAKIHWDIRLASEAYLAGNPQVYPQPLLAGPGATILIGRALGATLEALGADFPGREGDRDIEIGENTEEGMPAFAVALRFGDHTWVKRQKTATPWIPLHQYAASTPATSSEANWCAVRVPPEYSRDEDIPDEDDPVAYYVLLKFRQSMYDVAVFRMAVVPDKVPDPIPDRISDETMARVFQMALDGGLDPYVSAWKAASSVMQAYYPDSLASKV